MDITYEGPQGKYIIQRALLADFCANNAWPHVALQDPNIWRFGPFQMQSVKRDANPHTTDANAQIQATKKILGAGKRRQMPREILR